VIGDFVNTSVGGDSGAFERAISRGISGLVDELVKDEQFAIRFTRIGQASNAAVRLDQLDQLKNTGKISEEEYLQGRKRILDGI
jgi:hypothetical protein